MVGVMEVLSSTVVEVDGWWGPPNKAIVQGTLQGVWGVKPSPPMSFLAR